jgi:hypothetical protein
MGLKDHEVAEVQEKAAAICQMANGMDGYMFFKTVALAVTAILKTNAPDATRRDIAQTMFLDLCARTFAQGEELPPQREKEDGKRI